MSRPAFKRAIVVGVTAAVITTAAVAGYRFHLRPPPVAASPVAPAAAKLAGAGRQLVWAVKLETRLEQPQPGVVAGAGGAPAHGFDGTTTLTGDWVVTMTDASEGDGNGGYDTACELRGARVTGKGFGNVAPADVQQLEEKLSARFWASYQRDGAARALHFPREMGDDVRNFLTLLVTETQLVRPARDATQWTATERDGAGSYFSAYMEDGPGQVVKRKLRYLAVDGAGPGAGAAPGAAAAPGARPGAGAQAAAVNVTIDAAETRFTLAPNGLVAELAAHEEMHVDTNLGGMGLGIGIRLEMSRLRAGSAPELVGSLARARPGLETAPIVTQRASAETLEARRDARLIKDVTLTRLLDAVRDGNPDWRTRAALAAWLREKPADLPIAAAFVRQAAREPSRIVLDAIGTAATPEAQQTLCGLAEDAQAPTPLRVDALTGLVAGKRSSPPTIVALIRLVSADDPAVSRQALYVAGAVASQSRQADPAGAGRIEAELLDRVAKCPAPAACVDLLGALGNLATPTVLPAIERALKNPNAIVRSEAARALRRIDDPATDRLIAATMTGDADPRVRAAALSATTSRPFGPFVEPLVRLVEADPIDYVRSDAIGAAAKHVDESPLLRKALLAAATGDRSPGNQRLARQALGPRLAAADSSRR